jgi:hypothetical protein
MQDVPTPPPETDPSDLRRAIADLTDRVAALEAAPASPVADLRARAGAAWGALRGEAAAPAAANPPSRPGLFGGLVLLIIALIAVLLAVEVLDEVFDALRWMLRGFD